MKKLKEKIKGWYNRRYSRMLKNHGRYFFVTDMIFLTIFLSGYLAFLFSPVLPEWTVILTGGAFGIATVAVLDKFFGRSYWDGKWENQDDFKEYYDNLQNMINKEFFMIPKSAIKTKNKVKDIIS